MSVLAPAGVVIPTFGGAPSSYACERANRLFCPDWVSKNWSSVLWPALRRLGLLRLGDIALAPPPAAPDGGLHASTELSVRNAVSLMLGAGVESLVVTAPDGAPAGVLTLSHATELLRE